MNKEIELKAHVENYKSVKKILSEKYGTPVEIHKDDIYYIYKQAGDSYRGQPVRLRVENGKNVVTLKQKSIKDGIELNNELEFGVDNGESFIKYMQLTGARKWVVKTKNGWKYKSSENGYEAVIELCEVSNLGWYLEIEIVIESPDNVQITESKLKIKDILNSAGISEDQIESRYYSDMLLEK